MPSRSDNYEFIKGLGRGGFGIVELWRQLHGDEDLVVAKRVFVGDMSKMEVEDARQEARILKKIKHPSIVRYIGSWLNHDKEDLIIVQEYYVGGDMSHLISAHRKKAEFFPAPRVLRWLAQLSHALQYCHKACRLVHRDLKPSNLFLGEDHSSLHLGDFGIARNLGSTASLCQTFVGTQAYMSPEVTRMQTYGPKSDVWAFGTIIYELCTLKRLYSAADVVSLMHAIASSTDPPELLSDSGYPEELRNLCTAVLIKDPLKRPSFDQVLLEHDLLRVAVLQFERDAEWADSLVPAREEASEFMPVGDDDTERILRIFRRFDYNADGLIDTEELSLVLNSLDPHWHTGMADLLLETIDVNGDGKIEYSEFIEWIMESKDEWDEVRQCMLESSDAVEEEEQPSVVKEDGSPHQIDQGFSPLETLLRPSTSSLLDAAARSRARILGSSSVESLSHDSAESDAAATLNAVADLNDPVELTVRRREIEQLLAKFAHQEDELDFLCSDDCEEQRAHVPSGDVSSWSIQELKAYISAQGGSLVGISEKSELIELCRELRSKDRVAEFEMDDETQRNAAIVSTRLRCLKVMESEVPDPVELTISLRQAKDLSLDGDPCVKALVGHSCRLGMQAEDVVNGELSTLRELEDAAEVLEAARLVMDLLEAEERDACKPQEMLDRANQRLQNERQEKKQVGIRCQCGPFFKTLSVPPDTPWAEIKEELAQRWDRPVEAFKFFWRNGPDMNPLDSEESWGRCAFTQRKAAAVEVKATLDRSKMAPARPKRKTKAASRKLKASADKVRTGKPVAEKRPVEKPVAERTAKTPTEKRRVDKAPIEKPVSATPSPSRQKKRTLAGLAASSAPRPPSRSSP